MPLMPEKEQPTAKPDECSCCFKSRITKGLPPRKLVDTGTMTCGYNPWKRKFNVRVCEFCDSASEPV